MNVFLIVVSMGLVAGACAFSFRAGRQRGLQLSLRGDPNDGSWINLVDLQERRPHAWKVWMQFSVPVRLLLAALIIAHLWSPPHAL